MRSLDVRKNSIYMKREGFVICVAFVMRVESGGGKKRNTREKLGRGDREEEKDASRKKR
jgi:hypothetical protein